MSKASSAGKLSNRIKLIKSEIGNSGIYYENARGPNDPTVCSVNCTCLRNKKYATEKSIPGYKFIKYLGAGSFGAVHLYRSILTGGPVAIKEISYNIKGKNMYHEVVSEYTIAMSLNHPNITRYYDFFLIRNRYKCYIVMEYAKRGTLRELLQEKIKQCMLLEQNSVLRMIHDVIKGVQFLNRNHVVHCDLKPENILIDDNGKLKICDFGTAHFVYDINAPVRSTISYVAPERFEGMRPNEKTEVWSIGIIFYEMCTLMHPFKPYRTNNELISKIKHGMFKSLNCRLRGYSYDMQDLLELMLQRHHQCRQNLSNILSHKLLRSIQSESKY